MKQLTLFREMNLADCGEHAKHNYTKHIVSR